MAVSQKRRSPDSADNNKVSKKVKVARVVNHGTGSNAKTAKQTVRLDDLKWQEVSMPDRLEDYEGFFGLEEIDGVDIVKDASTNTIRYVAATAQSQNHAGADDDDEWDGFEEDADTIKLTGSEVTDGSNMTQSKASQGEQQVSSQPTKTAKAKHKKLKKMEPATSFRDLQEAGDVADKTDVSAWARLKLSPDTLAAIASLGFSNPTKIQQDSIPVVLKGADVIGKASTGSGKTLAFGIPILERFLELQLTRTAEDKTPLALILSPTRELAHQLNDHISALCSALTSAQPSVATLTGGLSMAKQTRKLKHADIIIGTPGRLWEVISSEKGLGRALKNLHFLVLDEADRLLSEGHFKEVEDILNVLDREDDLIEDIEEAGKDLDKTAEIAGEEGLHHQTLVFSATFDKSLQKKLVGKVRSSHNLLDNKDSMEYLLSKINFQNGEPTFVDANPVRQMAAGLKEGLIECGAMEKDLYLYAVLLHHPNSRAIVFVNSITAVRRVTPLLENLGLPALALHSGMIQKARLRSVERFTQGNGAKKASILVATDVAARGLDIPNVDLVVHYHLPRAADMYVHRSGRTARAGQQGSSILICSPDEVSGVSRLIAKVHAQTDVDKDEDATMSTRQGYYIRTLDPDRKVVARLKPRVTIAKRIADAADAKSRQNKEDEFFSQAAEDLGIDLDDEEFAKAAPGRGGKGSGRTKKDQQALSTTKSEVAGLRAELKEMLKQRINVGVSEKYITAGNVDINELLLQQELGKKTGEFIGFNAGFGFADM